MTLQYTRWPFPGIIPGMGSANERQSYHETSFQNDLFSSRLLPYSRFDSQNDKINLRDLVSHFEIKSPDQHNLPDSKVHGANMGPTWVLSAPDGPHVGPMNLAIKAIPNH